MPIYRDSAGCIDDRFTPPREQLEIVREWITPAFWSFFQESFPSCRKNVPEWPKQELVALVLVPYMWMGSTWRQEALSELCTRYNVERELPIPQDRLYMTNPLGPHPDPRQQKIFGFARWEIIDFGAGRGATTDPVQEGTPTPNIGTLVALGLHPKWAEQLGEPGVPRVQIPGCKIEVGNFARTGEPSRIFGLGVQQNKTHSGLLLRPVSLESKSNTWALPKFYSPL